MAPALEDRGIVGEPRSLLAVDQSFAADANTSEVLQRVRALHEEGLSLRAYELAQQQLGPLNTWKGTAVRILAGRLASHLGGSRLASAIHFRAWRSDRTDPEAAYYHAYSLLLRRGPLRTWRFLLRKSNLETATAIVQSDWLALHATVLGRLRDFDAAEFWLARAERLAPDHPWLWVERADLFQLEDRYEEALAAARQALALRPWYRPAVQETAHLLQLLDRDDEALELLNQAAERIESSPLLAQLGVLQAELGRHADARRSWDRFADLSPLLDAPGRRWLAGRRSDTAYDCGEIVQAAAHARECGDGFFRTIAERLETPGIDTRRVVLDVGFVRQHHQTCAPATIAAIARFWNKPADHLEIAEAICYDGSPDHRQRSWAEESGWVTREFTLTQEAAIGLLDRGVPFTLTTVGTQTAHLQAVIGYDARRGTLRIRDPSLPYSGEVLIEPFLASCRSVGPKCMVTVPPEEAGRLENIDLPEAALHDQLHALQVALHQHDREQAARAHERLQSVAPGHRLELQARLALAHYDANTAGLLAALEELLKLYPDDTNFRIGQLNCLRELGRREDRLAIFAERCDRPGADPILQRQYAQELLADAREHANAARLARRALGWRPTDAISFWVLGQTAWDAHRPEEAVELYRFAACLDDKDESLAQTYMNAARHLHQDEVALEFLKGRFRRFISRSVLPARTLHGALLQLERREEAFALLDEALALRPDDGDLLRFVAESHAAHGEFDRAMQRLEAARGHCRRGDWLRTAAYLASAQGDLVRSLSLWREVLDAEPMALDVNQMLARRLAETEGRDAALEHLEQACKRFPYNHALHQTWILWLRDKGPVALEPVIRRLLAIHPADAWARRELALALSQQGRHDEAFAEMRHASELDPGSHVEASVRAQVLERAGWLTEAREAYREAIRRSVDDDFSIGRLMETCDSRTERVESLAFIESELERQVIFGDGLLAFAHHARGTLGLDELLATLRRAQEARPDLWHAWSALIHELERLSKLEEALQLAQEVVARFPLLAAVWVDLAAVCAARHDADGENDALERALRIRPGWSTAARRRAQAYEKDDHYEQSRAILERAITHAPLDPYNHGCLADALWHLDRKDEALERLVHALRLEPDYEWAWNTLRDWSSERKRPEDPLNLARELTEQRGGEARCWLKLAEILSGSEYVDQRLAALDRAIALAPRQFEPHDLKAQILTDAGRYREAAEACTAMAWGDRPPVPLRGRAAWVEARRGDLQRAITQMRAVLAEDSDYYWGWQNLAEWCRDASKPADYLEAAEAMVRLAPDSPYAAGYRGDARQKTGDRAGAQDDYRRAIEQSPTYGFAVFRLFDLELEDKNFAAADRLLATLKLHHGGRYVAAREVQLAATRQDRRMAAEALDRLCSQTEGSDEWPLRAGDEAFANAGWTRQAETIYAQALQRQEVHPQTVTLWIEHWVKRPHWRLPPGLDELLDRGEVGYRAAIAYVNFLGRTGARRRLSTLLRRHGPKLRSNTPCWGSVGSALLTVQRRTNLVQWMSDWPDRADAQPWMLLNLVYALRAQTDDRAANEVSRRAIALPVDHCTPYHILWLVLDHLLCGEVSMARGRLDGLDLSSFDSKKSYLYRLARLLLELQEARANGLAQVRRQASRDLAALGRSVSFKVDTHAAIVHVYHRAVRLMAQHYGPVSGFFWKLVRWMNPPLKRR